MVVAVLCVSTLLSAQPEKSTVEVAPGVTLPASGTIYGLDSSSKGQSLVQLHATEIVLNAHTASNVARSMVYAGPHRSIEIPGISSASVLHTSTPVFFVHLLGDDPELMRSRLQIIRLNPAKDSRVVLVFTMNIFGGQRNRKYEEVPASKGEVPLAGWAKLSPQSPLEPGEYAIAFVTKDVNSFADEVYDFSIADDASPQTK